VSAVAELARRIEVIEAGYEYLLAYAAQGRQDDNGSEVRARLTAMRDALDQLGALVAQRTSESSVAAVTQAAAFLAAVDTDARTAQSAISFVLSRPTISSLLVDNLNASIHVRALLTDLFLVDEALKLEKPQPAAGAGRQ
jgi:hypothetical protein